MISSFTLKKEVILDAYLPQFENYSNRYNIFYGGAGSGKSHFVIQKMIFKMLKYQGRRALVIRKTQQSQRESTFSLFQTVLSSWGLLDACRVNKSYLEIELPNGSLFIFKGMDDSEKIKSIDRIDDIIIEEATELSYEDFDQLDLRLRSKSPYNQIHLMFNPVSKRNWVYRHWFEDEDKVHEDTVILHTSYKDNPHLSEAYVKTLERRKETNYQSYRVYALGEFATMDELIYQNVVIENFNKDDIIVGNKNIRAVFGLDFGYASDPTAFVAALHDPEGKKVYVYEEFYEGRMLNNMIANEIIKRGYRKEKIMADSATPKDIAELRALGVERVEGAKKGYVLSGVQYLQQHEIIVHPSCTNTIEELNNYSWSKDKDGHYINKPSRGNDHLLDALRYSLSDRYNVGRVKLLDKSLLGF